MPRTPPYSPGFRRQMVDLSRAGREPVDLAREFEPTRRGGHSNNGESHFAFIKNSHGTIQEINIYTRLQGDRQRSLS